MKNDLSIKEATILLADCNNLLIALTTKLGKINLVLFSEERESIAAPTLALRFRAPPKKEHQMAG